MSKKKSKPADKKKYWKERAIKKIGQAIIAGDDYLADALAFLDHAGFMDKKAQAKKMRTAYNNIKKSFNKFVQEIESVEIK